MTGARTVTPGANLATPGAGGTGAASVPDAGTTSAGSTGPGDPVVAQVPGGVTELFERAVDFIGSLDTPVVAVGVVVVAVAVAVVAARTLRRRRGRTPGAQFQAALAAPDTVSVLMHPNPDPDAMATAIGVGHLAEHLGTEAHLQYTGKIQHQENRAFEAVLDLDLEGIDGAGEITADEVVLVDHNEPRGFPGAGDLTPYAVVDHHPGDGTGTEHTDVRLDYGACASILAEYFQELDATVVSSSDEATHDHEGLTVPPDVATGLMYGIQSDTGHLTRGVSSAEFRACEYLYTGLDEDDIDRIANPRVDAETLDVKARAIRRRDVRPPYAVSDVGEVENLDAIPQSADELVTLESITAVVVFGRQDGTVHISGRSRDDRVHMGRVLEAVCDDIPMASAGGHARMGGGQVSIQHMEVLGPTERVGFRAFEDRLFDAMKGDI